MWVRKRLDIAWTDLLYGIGACLVRGRAVRIFRDAESEGADRIMCQAARSAFDLLLQALALPPGSEVLISAITIPDMVAIIRRHHLVPVPVDLDPVSLQPRIDALDSAATANARLLVVTHLFGGRFDSEPFVAFARRHDLLLVEDRAQAFNGPHECRIHEADVALYSFGPVKTLTAVGGGVAIVRDRRLLGLMRRIQDSYPPQSPGLYLRRILKYALLKAISGRIPFALLYRLCRCCRIDHDHLISSSARSFRNLNSAAIRRQPAAAMLRLLRRRLDFFDARQLLERARKGQRLVQALGSSVCVPGCALPRHTHWLFPVLVSKPERLIAELRAAGFDATQGESLCVVPAPDGRPETTPATAAQLLEKMVFVPAYIQMPDRELRRMAAIIVRDSRFTKSPVVPPQVEIDRQSIAAED